MNIRQYQTHGYGRYAVRLKENRKLIGMCGFLNEPYGIDFGYRYSKDSWGKGLGFEAARLGSEICPNHEVSRWVQNKQKQTY